MKRTKAKTQCEAEVRLGKKIGYLVVLTGGASTADDNGTFYDGFLHAYLREERKSVFGHIQPTREERFAIDAWMDKSEVGDVLFGAKQHWTITVVSTEREAIQQLKITTPDPVYTTESMRGRRNKKGKL